VIAVVNPRDPHHAKAVSASEQLSRWSLLVTEAALLEIGDGLARNFREQAVEIIEGFLESDEVEIVQTHDQSPRGGILTLQITPRQGMGNDGLHFLRCNERERH